MNKTIIQSSLIILCYFESVCCGNDILRRDLEKELLTDYNVNTVPTSSEGNKIVINASLYLLYIVDFNEREESLKSSTWLSLTWKDPNLSWDGKEKYTNITAIYLRQIQIWKPDFILLNSVEDLKLLGTDNLGVTVQKDGTVLWEPGQTFTSICEVNINMYPFDSQECNFLFGSWTYFKDIDGVLTLSEVGLKAYQENGKWEIIGSTAKCDTINNQQSLLFTIYIRRRRIYYLLTICIPLLILSIVNCLVHILPADSGEKMSFCTTVLLSKLVFISFLNDHLPSTSKTVSLLAVYLILVICLSFLSVVNSVIVLSLWYKSVTNDKQLFRMPCSPTKIADECLREKHGQDKNDVTSCEKDEFHAVLNKTYDECSRKKGTIKKFQQYSKILDRILFIVTVILTVGVSITFSTVMLIG